ncbi:MAG TPA: Rne/Rng family ribonuclease [Saprospiraceae bacterium]|mgnify:FL=1|nr:Rne/Rng family ribonuclease [Saprospiraceae bacterium]
MDKELVISSSPTEVEIALLEDHRLVEIHRQKTDNNFAVGDIYLGRIKRLMPGLNAAFVDLGLRKDAFLHFTDIGPQINSLKKYTYLVINKKLNTASLEHFEQEPDNPKNGKIDQVFERNTPVLVQVLKEPISTKGPRLTCEITLPGRYIVITPFNNFIAVSKKIASQEERKRLKVLVESIKPKKFGVIVRTAAAGKKVADLHAEIRELEVKWNDMYRELRIAREPKKLHSELDKTTSILRDILNDTFNRILVDDNSLYKGLKNYISDIAPDKVGIVKEYKNSRPIFDVMGVTKQIKSSFGKTFTLASGAYLVIESTEAMHVIDVNSGPKMQKKSQEDAALAVNVEAAEEIARQLRLRDIGGLIIIDFIDMRKSENKGILLKAMKQFMRNDRAQHTILPLSKFGLMQITRQRVRQEIIIDTTEVCPTCEGTGKARPTLLITDDLQRDLEFIIRSRPDTSLNLHVHPYVYTFLKKGFPSRQMRWLISFYKWIRIKQDANFAIHEYKFFDGNQDEIRL